MEIARRKEAFGRVAAEIQLICTTPGCEKRTKQAMVLMVRVQSGMALSITAKQHQNLTFEKIATNHVSRSASRCCCMTLLKIVSMLSGRDTCKRLSCDDVIDYIHQDLTNIGFLCCPKSNRQLRVLTLPHRDLHVSVFQVSPDAHVEAR